MLESIINKLKEFFQNIVDMFKREGEESEIHMKARDLGIISAEFDDLYEKLLKAEDDLRDISTKYTIGEEDVKMTDVDVSFSHMKKAMKDVRNLAVEARNSKEERDEK